MTADRPPRCSHCQLAAELDQAERSARLVAMYDEMIVEFIEADRAVEPMGTEP